MKLDWDPNDCKGIYIFRYVENDYYTNQKKLVYSQEWRFMKRLSCKCAKCHECGPFRDCMEGGMESLTLDLPKVLIPNKLYQFVFTAGGRDWETGVIDDWYWKVVEVREDEARKNSSCKKTSSNG